MKADQRLKDRIAERSAKAREGKMAGTSELLEEVKKTNNLLLGMSTLLIANIEASSSSLDGMTKKHVCEMVDLAATLIADTQ